MIRFNFFIILIFILISLVGTTAAAQMAYQGHAEVSLLGWADDSHYLLKSFDSNRKSVVTLMDIKSGNGSIVPTVKSERELLSELLPRNVKLTAEDIVSPDAKSILFVRENDLFYFVSGAKELRRLTDDKSSELNARFSPDSKNLAYTKNKELYVFDLLRSKETRLTFDASDRIYNGYSSWVYMEEILGRDSHYAAFWWSPDGTKIAYLRTDETDVPVFTLNRLDEPDGIHGVVEATPYPKPGDPNPRVKMGIADILTAKTVWVNLDYSIDQYIAWPFWTPDSKKLAIQLVNRDQNDLKIILAEASNGDFKQIYDENRKTWIEFHEDIYVMRNGKGFIIRSYRNDWENLYYYGWDGKLIVQLTDFDFRVTEIEQVDEDLNVVYFLATGPESTDIHFFRVGLDGKNLLQISRGEGTHKVSVSPGGTFFIDTWNSLSDPGSIIAINKKGRFLNEVYKFEEPGFDSSERSKSEMIWIPTSDGLFNMPAIITYPLNFDSSKKYPVVFTIYGGPDSRNVYNKWQGINPSWYSLNNIITFTVDHRGSGHFGKKGLDYLYRSLGKWEISDYEDAVDWLRSLSYVDAERMGITGSSYGGYVTCLALTKGADYWTHGFAGSSVTDYRLYDNIYTERFMDTPEDNPDGYREGSALTFVSKYRGHLYLTHGDMDDNVHLQNSIYLISKLQDEGKKFEFMLYPGGRHGWHGPKAVHLRNEAHAFWLRNFFGKSDSKKNIY